MTALEQFNALNGTKAYRKDLENILQKAKDENNASLVYRISKTLNAFPDVNSFEIEIISYPEAPQGLSGAQHSGNYKEALDDCGRLRKGWKFVKGNVVKIQKKEKPKKESKPKKETGPVKSKEENNSKKETKKDKKYKFVVITDDRPSRVIAVFSYTNPNIKDLRESFWKNGEGKYYETTEEGLRNYTFGMGVYPFEEAKKHIEEKYTEGKDFIYFIIEKDGGRDEAISLVEKPKKETDKTAIDEIKKIVQERLKNQGKPRLYEVLHLESAKGIFIFSWSDLGNIDGTKKKENALAKGLYQYTFPKFKNTQEKIEFSNQVWYDLLINKSLTLKRDIEEPTLNIINYYLGKNTIEDIESASKKTTEEAKPKKGKTPKIKDFEAFDNLKSQLVAENADIPKNEVLEFLYNFVDRFEEGKTKYQFWNTPDNRPSEAVLQYKKHPFLNRIQNPSAKMRAYELTPRGYKLVEKFYKGIEHIKNTYEYKFIVGIHRLDGILRDRKNYAEEQEKAPTKETGPVKAKEEESKAEEKTSAKKELPRDFSEDLDYKSLYNSYSMSSFDPERRAENDKKMFGASMLNLYNSSVEEAKENNRLEEYNQAFERYYAVILKKNKEVISARTGTFSTAVTGRAGIKGSQLRKNEAKQKREYEINKELIDYIEKAEKKLNEVARNPDRFYSDQAIKSTDKNAIEKLNQKIEQLEAEKDFIKRSEKACKEYQKTKDFSVFEKYNIPQKEAKEYVEQIERHGLPLIKGISSISAEIRRVKERIALLEKSKASEDENFDIENGRILVNKEAQRVQIFFDNIPDANTRDALKKRAFKWAPSAKAWQRTLTGNAIDAVKYLIKDGVLVKKNSEKTGLNAPRHEGILKEALNECGRLKKGWKFEKGKAVKVDTKKGKDKEGEQKELDLYMQEMKTAIKKSKAGKFDKKNILSWLSKFPDKIKGQLYSFLYHNYLLDKEEAKLRKSKKPVPFSLINTQYDINKFVSQLFDLEKEDFFDLYFFFIYNMDECIELLEDKEVKKNYYEKKKKGLSGVDYSQVLFDDIGLNAPRHEGILKEALTEKGKLKKGWYFQDYGIFDPKGKYHPLEREFAYEYKIASDELRSRAFKQDEKNKQKGFEENIQIENNLKEFFKTLSQKNRKYFKSYKAVEIFYWAFGFEEKPTKFFTIEETNPYNEIQLKVFDKYFSSKNELFTRLENYETLRRYDLTNLGLKIITEIVSFLNKEGKKVRGDVKKIDKKYGLNAPRHEGILKEALTEKGKLKKGWYFQDYGIFDPKGEYFTLERETPEEYEIIKKVLDDKNSKIKSKINEKIYQKEKQQSADRYSKEQSLYLELYEKNNFSKNLTYDYFVFFLSNGMKGFGINEKYSERSFILNTNSPIQKKYIKTLSENNLVEDIKLVEKKQISGRVHYQYQVFLLSKGISLIKKYIKGYREIYNYDENLKKNKQKYGLSMPFYVQEQEKKEIQPSSNSISNKIKAFQGRNFEIFNIENPDLSTFLGEIERKNIGSNVITLTGGAGSGKTRFAFQFMNALAQNYKVGHASLEEHPESKLYFDKVTQYLDSQAQNNISVLENETLDGLENLINENEVIVIDSFAKLREMDSKFLVDKDLRKKYNGKLFLVIFQQTSDGKMRGGSTSEFDGDIILFTKTFDDPKENFVYPSKNRYNALPLSELKYSVFYQQLLHDEEQEQPVTDLIFDVVY